MSYTLSCESTVDMPFSAVAKRNISVLFYSYLLGEQEYEDIMGRDDAALENFYRSIAQGILPSTTQINTYKYIEYFEPLLEKGDIFHLTLSSGITSSYTNAVEAANQLMQKYPDRKIVIIDSLCASSGFGLFVDNVADKRDEGYTIDQLKEYAEKTKQNVKHLFFSTDMTMFRRSGRVSGSAATIATVLNICPVMKVTKLGKLEAFTKVRGKDKATEFVFNEMKKQVGTSYSKRCYISNSNCLPMAEALKEKVVAEFGCEVKIFDIGTTIASHAGKGTVAFFFESEADR